MNGLSQPAHTSRAALWFGLLGGAFAWLVHLVFAYIIAEFGCVSSLAKQSWQGISLVAWMLFALTAITEIVAIAAIVAARCSRSGSEEGPVEARPSMARAGVITSVVFAGAILFESIPILYYLRSC